MKSISVVAALVALANGREACPETDELEESSLLQLAQKATAKTAATALLEMAHSITAKVKSGQDPVECFDTISQAREAVDAGLAAIPGQFETYENMIQIAHDNVQACANRQIDGEAMVTQQGTDLVTARTTHAACRNNQESLEAGLAPCEELETLRNSLGDQQCFSLPVGPEEGEAWLAALQAAVTTLQGHVTLGAPLLESCNAAQEAYAASQTECATAQRQFEEEYCAHRASCASLQICQAAAEENYLAVEAEVQAGVATLQQEYRTMTQTSCVLEANIDALNQNTDPNTAACAQEASVDHLTINYPTLESLTTCDSTILTNPPCTADFVAAEYHQFAQSDAIIEECLECPVMPLEGAPASWLREVGPIDVDNLQPRDGSPAGCTCSQVQLVGDYSAGIVVRCDNCIATFRSTDPDSCPIGMKLISPRSQQDWETLFYSVSMNDFRKPHLIADVTRPEDSCGGCTTHAMNSDTPGQSSWVTSDGSPWFLHSTTYGEPNGDYTANCYLYIGSYTSAGVTFNDGSCRYSSNSYLCQVDQREAVR